MIAVKEETDNKKMAFYQWMNAHEGVTRREYTNEISAAERVSLKVKYKDYLKGDYY